ncbi:MAG: chromosome partitioning protein [Gemmatimonadetes bacterium]|nr:MAG: chromosome partitioning protein [Gemmatimonadota bacterium]
MSEQAIKTDVEQMLGGITSPRHGRDLMSAGMVRDITVDAAGAVTFTFVLTREDPGSLARQARKAVESVPGVSAVKMNVVDSADGSAQPAARPSGGGRPAAAPSPPAPPTPDEMPSLGKVLAISSGKGGVGKSTVSANLAAALAQDGHRVALMDADIYGPNIPRMFGANAKPDVQGGKIQPLEAHGVKLMSLGFIVERDAPAIWRGPIIMKIITQFLRDVAWGELDYFLVDLPPGTGDAQLSLTQIVRLHGAIIVTTPQEMAVGDSLRGAKMFERVGVGVVGIVENMSYFVCPDCHARSEIFLAGGGTRLAAELGVPLLGQIPLQAGMAELADRGEPIVVSQPDSPAGIALRELARTVATRTAGLAPALPISAAPR